MATYFDDFPEEMLFTIMSYLDPGSYTQFCIAIKPQFEKRATIIRFIMFLSLNTHLKPRYTELNKYKKIYLYVITAMLLLNVNYSKLRSLTYFGVYTTDELINIIKFTQPDYPKDRVTIERILSRQVRRYFDTSKK